MFVIVQERMEEVGSRRSVGAMRYHIMGQFFTETFAVITIGAAAGYGIGWLLVQLTQNLPIKDFVGAPYFAPQRSEEHTSELQSRGHLVCRLLLEKKNNNLLHIFFNTFIYLIHT